MFIIKIKKGQNDPSVKTTWYEQNKRKGDTKQMVDALTNITSLISGKEQYDYETEKYNKHNVVIPASYIIYIDGSTIKAVSGTTGVVDYSGTDAATVINSALSNLTVGRTWKEKVVIKGNYTINGTIKVPSYTSLDIQGKLTLGADVNLIESYSLTTEIKSVEIYGGILDGIGHSSYDGIEGLFSNSIISGMCIENFNNGIHLTGVDWGANRAAGVFICNSEISWNDVNIFLDAYAGDNWVYANGIGGWTKYGLQIHSPYNWITENHIWRGAAATAAMFISTNVVAGSCSYNRITSNGFSSREDGIILDVSGDVNSMNNLIISSNTLRDISISANNTYDCIRLQRLSGTKEIKYVSIIGNKFFTAEINKPRYGIYESFANTSNNYIADNSFNNITMPMSVNVGTKVKNNIGYVTENNVLSNALAIDSTGIKTVTIPHGLAITPAVQDCYLTIVQNTVVDDWAYNMLKVVSTDPKNVIVKINISTASATVGATAKLALRVGNP